MSESELESGRCDFCQIGTPKHTINGGLWWICDDCMRLEYEMIASGGEEE